MRIAPKIFRSRLRAVEDAVDEWTMAQAQSTIVGDVQDLVEEAIDLVPAVKRVLAHYWEVIGTNSIDEVALADVLDDAFHRTLQLFPRLRGVLAMVHREGYEVTGRERLDQAELAIRAEVEGFLSTRPKLDEATVTAAMSAADSKRTRTL